jgi:hypothetical protein
MPMVVSSIVTARHARTTRSREYRRSLAVAAVSARRRERDGAGRLQADRPAFKRQVRAGRERPRRLSGLRSSSHNAVPLHEYPALSVTSVSRDIRRRWISVLGSRCSSAAAGTRSMLGTTPSPYRSHPNRSWPGSRRRRDFDDVWLGGTGTIHCPPN